MVPSGSLYDFPVSTVPVLPGVGQVPAAFSTLLMVEFPPGFSGSVGAVGSLLGSEGSGFDVSGFVGEVGFVGVVGLVGVVVLPPPEPLPPALPLPSS